MLESQGFSNCNSFHFFGFRKQRASHVHFAQVHYSRELHARQECKLSEKKSLGACKAFIIESHKVPSQRFLATWFQTKFLAMT